MKSLRQLVLRHFDAPMRVTRPTAVSDVVPVANGMRVDIPCEVIDLSGDLGSAPRMGYLPHRRDRRR